MAPKQVPILPGLKLACVPYSNIAMVSDTSDMHSHDISSYSSPNLFPCYALVLDSGGVCSMGLYYVCGIFHIGAHTKGLWHGL